MKIGINGYEAVVARFGYDEKTKLPNRVGSSEVCFQWLTWLSKIDTKNTYTIYLPVKPTNDMPAESDRWRYKILSARKMWTITSLSRELIKERDLDVFFSPSHYGPLFTPCPQAITILDVSYRKYPELFNKVDLYKLALWGKYSVAHARKVITISKSSKDDIMAEYKTPAEKVVVSYLGVKEGTISMKTSDALFKKYSLEKPYVLFVGTLQPRKNVERLIEAFLPISVSHKDLTLVIVGKKGWQYEGIVHAPKRLGIEARVKFLESITDDELPAFYKNAEVFVLPSLYEGFGLPVLEAMKYGCPVITSNVSSLPEAGGDAALYVNPQNTDEITKAIDQILTDPKLRKSMIERGNIQYKKFTWEESARTVLKTLESIQSNA